QAPQAGAEATQNDEGDFVETSPPVWMLAGKCRDEVNSKGETITQVNGENVQIQAIIYAPKDTTILPHGSKVVVSKEKMCPKMMKDPEWVKTQMMTGMIRIKDSVKGCSQTRLNMRIWV